MTNTRRLSKRERQQLRAIIRTESAAQVVRRAQALLWLANGESVPAVAERLGVVRQTIYNWQQVFIRRSTEPLPQRLRDEPRSGRPARKMAMALCWLPRLLRCSPRAFGYRARSWTSGRLCKQIERHSHRTQYGAAGVASDPLPLQTSPLCAGAALSVLAPSKRGLKTGLKQRRRTLILFADSLIINEVPPLQAVWAPVGTQACVPIIAAHDRRVLTAVLAIQTGSSMLMSTAQYTQVEFQALLPLIRRHWRGWHIVLFVDKHSAHTARRSRRLARQLGIELRWLPRACPELNPVDHLWRHLTRDVLANEPTPTLAGTVQQAFDYWWSLTPRERLRQAGVLSADFWMADLRH